jgi:hypothetical protein
VQLELSALNAGEIQGYVKNAVYAVCRNKIQRLPHRLVDLLEVGFVFGRDNDRLYASPHRSHRLLFKATYLHNAPSERYLPRHRDIAPHRSAAQRGNDRYAHRYPG